MIRLNLAKGAPSPKKGGARKKRKSPTPAFIMFLILLAGGGGYYYYTVMLPEIREAHTPPPPPPPKPPVPLPKDGAKPADLPSSHVRTQIVEDVVKEISGEPSAAAAAGRLDAQYSDMTIAEKINYEVLFARNVFNMVTKLTPPGIKFRSLEVENFQSVYLSGAGITREMVQEMFAAFRSERGELMPRPYSNIKDDPGEGGSYNFTIMHKPRFQTVADPYQAIEHVGFRDILQQHVRDFSRMAGENNFIMSAAPAQMLVERTGSYRRVTFKAAGMSTYKDFHRFVLALYDAKSPAAFKKVSIAPVKDEQVMVTAEVLFTVKE
ncbi:MAG: hypothetical protein FWB85_06650 [Chitinispirillia bacterium]|nr:hypothetical protein [Chitinispirillia bacterium]MCL2241902.1 hypothetical protein [Chitinispirillia bacterium]